MESWQLQHIEKNKIELVKATICNKKLIEKLIFYKILNTADAERLETLSDKNFEKSKKLYKLLVFRDSYSQLVQALNDTRQTRAVKILSECNPVYRNYGCISYDKNHVLGTGSSGTKVFGGLVDGNDVAAVKILNADCVDPDVALKEVEFLSRLTDHSNILKYFTLETSENFVYLAMELCYISLQDEVKLNMLNIDNVAVLRQSVEGLAYLHKLNVFHGDMKPTNILLKENGQVKISDYGLSKQIPMGMTTVSFYTDGFGTTDWMAPELLQLLVEGNGIHKEKQSSTDIFSLGCVFFFVHSKGKHPFGEAFSRQVNILNGKYDVEAHEIDNEWKKIITRMISYDADKRPTTQEILLSSCLLLKKHERRVNNKSSNGIIIDKIPDESQLASSATELNKDLINKSEEHTSILSAVLNGSGKNELKRLIKLGMEWNYGNENGKSILHWAAEGGNAEAIKYFVGLGVDIHSKDSLGEMPVHYARFAKKNFEKTVTTLLKLGADVNARRKDGNSLLGLAALEGRSKKDLEWIFKNGGNINLKDENDRSVLHLAIRGGNVEAVAYLISIGADIRAKDDRGQMPIQAIPYTNQNFKSVVDTLLEQGADINASSGNGDTPLGLTTLTGKSKDDIEYIIDKGGDHKMKNKSSESGLHLAVQGGNSEAIKLFTSIAVRIHSKDQNFQEALNVLLKQGADINATRNDGSTPLVVPN